MIWYYAQILHNQFPGVPGTMCVQVWVSNLSCWEFKIPITLTVEQCKALENRICSISCCWRLLISSRWLLYSRQTNSWNIRIEIQNLVTGISCWVEYHFAIKYKLRIGGLLVWAVEQSIKIDLPKHWVQTKPTCKPSLGWNDNTLKDVPYMIDLSIWVGITAAWWFAD